MLVFEIDRVAATDVSSIDIYLHVDEVAERFVGMEVQLPGDHLAPIHSNWFQEQQATLIPMSSRAFWSSAKNYGLCGTQKADIEPAGEAVHYGCDGSLEEGNNSVANIISPVFSITKEKGTTKSCRSVLSTSEKSIVCTVL